MLFFHIGGALGIFLLMLSVSVWTKNGIGGGDVKLLTAISLWLGFTNSLIVLFVSCISFFAYALKNKENKTVAYVPFIYIGTLAVLFKEAIFFCII